MFHADALELKGNPSLVLRKMTRSLGHMMRLCHPLHAMNGWLPWKIKWSPWGQTKFWELVDLPPGRKSIGNKWVLKIKRKANGSIDKYKARLVVKGYTQREGVDYKETFSLVLRFASISLILAMVTSLNLELHQMDVKTAFLNGELDEEIFYGSAHWFCSEGIRAQDLQDQSVPLRAKTVF